MRTRIKRTVSFLLTAALILSFLTLFASCGNVKRDTDKPYVIGTVFPPFDFARQIGGDLIDCEMLLPPGADSHSFSGDSPSDILKISKCDLFIYVGGETDSEWVMKIKEKIEKNGEKGPVFLSLCECTELIGESGEGIVESEDGEEGEEEYDEHVWTSPKNAAGAADAICAELERIDPVNAGQYRSNADAYIRQLRELDDRFLDLSENASNKTLVFADRFPFRYLADEMGLKCYAAFNGCASQSEPSPTTIAKLCGLIEEKEIKYVFYIETSQSRVPELISGATGAEALKLHSCHTVTQKELDNGVTYLSLMEQNLENLGRALNNGK